MRSDRKGRFVQKSQLHKPLTFLGSLCAKPQDAINYLDATIAKLGLTAEAFDAAIASRPDALEKLAGEALGEKSKTNACFDCGSGDVADTCPECQKAFCKNCVEADEDCCEKEETI